MEEYEFDITVYVSGNVRGCYSLAHAHERVMENVDWMVETFGDSLTGRVDTWGGSLDLTRPIHESRSDNTQHPPVLENNIWGYP